MKSMSQDSCKSKDDTRTLKYRYNLTDYTITLKKGNYTSTSLLNELSSLFLIQGLTATCTLDKQSGKSLFVFSNNDNNNNGITNNVIN